jgi:hypothetical protein
LELELTDLEAVVVAGHVVADDYPITARAGRKPLISDAELVASSASRNGSSRSHSRCSSTLNGRPARAFAAHDGRWITCNL